MYSILDQYDTQKTYFSCHSTAPWIVLQLMHTMVVLGTSTIIIMPLTNK